VATPRDKMVARAPDHAFKRIRLHLFNRVRPRVRALLQSSSTSRQPTRGHQGRGESGGYRVKHFHDDPTERPSLYPGKLAAYCILAADYMATTTMICTHMQCNMDATTWIPCQDGFAQITRVVVLYCTRIMYCLQCMMQWMPL